jgi:peroxiredoxin Q/BCP
MTMIRLISSFAFALFLSGCVPAALAEQPAVGDAAPDFELKDQDGEMHSIEDYRGKWVALYFYPKDGTPGCTTEACEFRDNVFAFRGRDCQILGVSLDDEESHKEFSEKHGLPFPLLADTDGAASEAYGVKGRMLGFAVAKRQTFLIDPEGKVARHYQKVDPDTHSQEILADLDELQGGD